MSLSLRSIILEVPDRAFEDTVAFWAKALGGTPQPVAEGHTALVGPDSVCGVSVMRVAGTAGAAADADAAMRLELAATDLTQDLARLTEAGARHLGVHPVDRTQLLASPAGVIFGVVGPGSGGPQLASETGTARLDAVFVDVPAADQDTCVAFWTRVFASSSTVSTYRSEYTRLNEVDGAGGRVDFEVQRIGDAPRVHVDLSTLDVTREAARLQGLGATRVGQVDTWVILRDPAGLLCCVVPRHFVKETP